MHAPRSHSWEKQSHNPLIDGNQTAREIHRRCSLHHCLIADEASAFAMKHKAEIGIDDVEARCKCLKTKSESVPCWNVISWADLVCRHRNWRTPSHFTSRIAVMNVNYSQLFLACDPSAFSKLRSKAFLTEKSTWKVCGMAWGPIRCSHGRFPAIVSAHGLKNKIKYINFKVNSSGFASDMELTLGEEIILTPHDVIPKYTILVRPMRAIDIKLESKPFF